MPNILTRNTNDYWHQNRTDILTQVAPGVDDQILDHLDFREIARVSPVSRSWNRFISKYFREGARVRRLAIIPPVPLSSRVHDVLDLANFQRPIGPARKLTGKELIQKHGILTIQEGMQKLANSCAKISFDKLGTTQISCKILSPYDPDLEIAFETTTNDPGLAKLAHTWVLEQPLKGPQSVGAYKQDQMRIVDAGRSTLIPKIRSLIRRLIDLAEPIEFRTVFGITCNVLTQVPPKIALPVEEAVQLFDRLKEKNDLSEYEEVELETLLAKINKIVEINRQLSIEIGRNSNAIITRWAEAPPPAALPPVDPAIPPVMGPEEADHVERIIAALNRHDRIEMAKNAIMILVVAAIVLHLCGVWKP